MEFKSEVLKTIENTNLLISTNKKLSSTFNMHVSNLLSLKEGDMYAYLNSYSNSLKEINKLLKENQLNSFNDLLIKYEDKINQFIRFKIHDFEIGKRYNSCQICAIGRCNNKMLGMYYVNEDEEYIVIKATTDGKGKYPNQWLNGSVLKYYLRADNNLYNESVFNTEPNYILRERYDNNKNINILCFSRDSKKENFICQGLFKLQKLVISNEGYWIEIKKKYSKLDSKKYENEIMEYKEDLYSMSKVNDVEENNAINYVDEIKKAPNPIISGNSIKYKRNPIITKKALINSNYKCEYDGLITFTSQSTNNNYVEGHHLIPMSKQGEFEYDIDNTANIVALCPKCHMLLHHAKFVEKKEIIEKLYSKRKENLERLNIKISLDKLLDYYR